MKTLTVLLWCITGASFILMFTFFVMSIWVADGRWAWTGIFVMLFGLVMTGLSSFVWSRSVWNEEK